MPQFSLINGIARRALLLFIAFLLLIFARQANASTIDIMLVYDTTATSWVNNNGGLSTFSEDAVNRMNLAMQNSGINLSFRLVHIATVAYTHQTLTDDLLAITNDEGAFSEIPSLRDIYGADIVALMVDTGSAYGYVGIGWLLTTWSGLPSHAYTANSIRSVEVGHTLTHEVGHNLGAHHSKYQSQDPGPNSYLSNYSAGWYLTGTNNVKYHTIMAYQSDGYGNTYQSAPLFSTPLLTWQGTAAGHATNGDNASLIDLTKQIVSNYRASTVESQMEKRLAVTFTGAGLWYYDGTSWARLHAQNPQSMTAWDGGLAADFDAEGLWNHAGGGWQQLLSVNARSIYPWSGGLSVDLGAQGLWSTDGTGWARLSTASTTESMTAWNNGLVVDFGNNGLWFYDEYSFNRLNSRNVEQSTAWSGGLAVDFGADGLWNYTGGSWSRLNSNNAQRMTAWSGGLAVDFGQGGVWSTDGIAWRLITSAACNQMTAWNNGLVLDLGPSGLWHFTLAGWQRLASFSPEGWVVWGDELAADLGDSGLWSYNGSSWYRLSSAAILNMCAMDLE